MIDKQQIFKVAVIGDGDVDAGSEQYVIARDLGCKLIDEGYWVVTGGREGVMEAASRGAHDSKAYQHGCVLGYLPGHHTCEANQWVDVPIATGLGHMRNAIVAQSDAVIAIGGSAGTLSEMCFAWIFGRLIIAVEGHGWAGQLAGQRLDNRVRYQDIEDDCLFAAKDADHAISILKQRISQYTCRYER